MEGNNLLQSDERIFINGDEKYKFYNVDTLDKMYDKFHEHDFVEIFILLNGSVTYSIEHCVYDLKNYDILVVHPHVLHKLSIVRKDEGYKRMVLWVKTDYLNELSSSKTNLNQIIDNLYKEKIFLIRNYEFTYAIKKYLSRIEQFQKEDWYGSDLMIENTLRELFLSFYNYLSNSDDDTINYKMKNPVVSNIVQYIDSHLSDDLSLKAISNALSFDASYLSHIFTEIEGLTIHKYIIKKRLVASKSYLSQGKSIIDTANLVGFKDNSHFIQAFKKEFGITPKKYQTQLFATNVSKPIR